jgi:thymidine phosphorylase
VLYELRTDDPSRIPAARDIAAPSVVVTSESAPIRPLIIDRIG